MITGSRGMPGAELSVRSLEESLHKDQLASIVPFDRMADELQQVADDKRDQCPRRRILVVPDEKMDRQDERDRQAQQMKELVAGMEMPFRVVLEESLHEFAVQFARSPVFKPGCLVCLV